MAQVRDSPWTKNPAHVTLDGQAVELPSNGVQTLTEIFAYLERLAVTRERVLATVSVDGTTVKTPGSGSAFSGAAYETFQNVEANSISFKQLGSQVVDGALGQIRTLLNRLEIAQVLVLINDWPVIQRIWWDIVPDFKPPMLALSFLQELWGERLSRITIAGRSLAEHWDQVGHIQADLELNLNSRRDTVEFSDVIERRLVRWLWQLCDCLEDLQAEAGR